MTIHTSSYNIVTSRTIIYVNTVVYRMLRRMLHIQASVTRSVLNIGLHNPASVQKIYKQV